MKPTLLTTTTFLIISLFSHAQTDQDLVWASYFGGDGLEYPNSVVSTADGGALFVGFTTTTLGITTMGSHQPFYGGGDSDGFILKIDSDKQKEWVSYFGGDGSDAINDVKVLSDGSFVIVGSTSSEGSIATADAFIDQLPGVASPYVACFSEYGEQLWGTYLGGSQVIFAGSYASTVAIDDQDNIIVCGVTRSTDFPVTENAHQESYAGDSDGFISKFDSDGNLLWSSYLGGSEKDEIHDVVIASNNDIVVFGYTESTSGFATPSAHQTEYAGEGDAFLVRFSAGGERLWGTYYGGPGFDRGGGAGIQSLAIDEQDNLYIRTETESAQGVVTPGAPIDELQYNLSVVLSRFSSDGQLLWGTYFGANVYTSGGGISILSNQIVIGGNTRTDAGYIMGTPYQAELLGTNNSGDIFFAGFDLDGNQLWGTYFGGPGSDLIWHLSPYSENQFIFAGNTQSGIVMPDDAFQSTFGGMVDGLLGIFDISNVTSIAEMEAAQLMVFPNPTSSHIRLQLPPEFAFQSQITVYNLAGQVVAQRENFNSSGLFPMNHPPGLYLVEARSENKVARGKVVVE